MMKRFCCCISLEAGAKVVSIVSMLMSGIILVLYGSTALMLKLSPLKTMFYATMGLTSGLQCMSGILLCCGAFQRRPKLMWPWLMITWFTGISLLGLSIAGYVLLIAGRSLTADANLVMFVYVIYSLFLVYCACAVNSRRLQLVKEDEEEKSVEPLMMFPRTFKDA